ncbi:MULTISPECIES: lipopolysaccharide biosynthesis protein [unclassified Marinobacter]|uniref:lipopolysaccharide biosynthesis protein n=1 Tax=unclassified Marinobacter TaxID=83889 RepID=UPI0018F12B91|nr:MULTISPECIES: lipopolysaccharide biosynthesis protein [unclassified Marinobacter]
MSLVDLATTFIRRRRIFYATFFVIITLALIYALMAPAKYEYISLVQLAKDGKGGYLEAPSSVVATVENRWVPEQVANFAERNQRDLPFRVQAGNPKDTNLIRLITETTEEQRELVNEIHANLIADVIDRQQQLIEAARNTLDKRIASQDTLVEALQAMEGSESAGSALVLALQEQAELENDREAMKPAEVLVTSRKSTGSTGPAKALIVTLGGLLGLLAGLSLAFISEFIALVRIRLSDMQEE